MNYAELKQKTNRGWNTWNTRSVLSHACLPYGFAINLCLKDHTDSSVLREALVGRGGKDEEHIFPGIRSWDGSYTTFDMEYRSLRLTVESTASGDDQLILVNVRENTGRVPATLIVEACLLWGKEGSVSKKNGRLCGDFPDGRHFDVYTSKEAYNMAYTWSLSPNITVDLDEPVVVSTFPCTVEEARERLDKAAQKVRDEAAVYGDNAETYTAMKTCLAWDTIYDSEHDRVCSPVSRQWSCGWGGYVLFDWDTYFASLLSSVDNPELSYLNAIAITNEVTEKGFIPNFGAADDYKSRDRSQPPVGSMATLEIYKKYGADWFVREVYPALRRWNRWFWDNRRYGEAYLCWGSNAFDGGKGKYWETNVVGNSFGAALESGLDNSPMYDDMPFDNEREIALLADVGLMGMYIKDCACLEELCRIADCADDAAEYAARREKVEEALQTLWSEPDGMFENKNLVTGELSDRVSPTNFYSLYSQRVTDEQKKSMLERYFYNPDEFWGDYIMPSISRRDPAYPDQNYWRGRIWAPMNFLVYMAMKDAGLTKDAKVLADKSRNLLLKEWRSHGHVHENYSGDDGTGCGVGNSDKFYHWGGLLGYIALDAETL